VAMANFEHTYKKQVKKNIIITKNELSKESNIYKIPFYLLDFLNF
jgi:hypothetical protein